MEEVHAAGRSTSVVRPRGELDPARLRSIAGAADRVAPHRMAGAIARVAGGRDRLDRPQGPRDVSRLGPGELDRMARSQDPAERRLAQTIARAQAAYADTIARGGRVLVGTSPGNGGYPVVTIVPPGFDPTKPARVQTHYHGWNATAADPRGHSAGVTARIAEVQARDPQAVFVLPECRNAPAGGGPVRTDWSNVSSQARTTEDALRGAGITSVGVRVVSAHSGGGAALSYAIRRNPDGSGLAADRLELHDSLYGSEADIVRWAGTQNGAALRELRYFRGTNDERADAGFPAAFGARYRRIVVRHPDAHNQTVAANLGSRD